MPLTKPFPLVLLTAFCAFSQTAPVPLLKNGHPVDWWFVFKFNSGVFPGCAAGASTACLFGGQVQKYKPTGQQYVFASSEKGTLQEGGGCAGGTSEDPIGATFEQVYNGSFFYAIWNDQFKGAPTRDKDAPWGHSKGMAAWNSAGEGFVMQVSTPSWPGAGNKDQPRKNDGNTLGCVKDNDIKVSQHFFALKVTKDDLAKILKALQTASVVTDPKNRSLVRNGGPADIQKLVAGLGVLSHEEDFTHEKLSSGVQLIAKTSDLNVPVWQMVSAVLDGIPLRAATWWTDPPIFSTTATTKIGCWSSTLGKPGAVEIATSGHWAGKEFSLEGGPSADRNHAKIGVSTSGSHHYAIFGDENQQGAMSPSKVPKGPKCDSSQNGRGGIFYVLEDADLFASMTDLLRGNTAPAKAPVQ
jgi:Deoxyribonuclease II